MARGGHGLPKVSLGPAMPSLSTPCERATRTCLLPHWIVIRRPLRGHNDTKFSPGGLSAAWGATLRAYLVFLVTITSNVIS
jgi:hypothetical protein